MSLRHVLLLGVALAVVVQSASIAHRRRHRRQLGFAQNAPLFRSFGGDGGFSPNSGNVLQSTLNNGAGALQSSVSNFVNTLGSNRASQAQPNLSALDVLTRGAPSNVDIRGLTSGQFNGLAPIPVPGFPGPQDIPQIPGVNTIPGLDMWNYLVGQLVPQTVPAANQLLGGSISRLFPQEATKNLASDLFKMVQPKTAHVDIDRMMGRWFNVINSPHVIREACMVSHLGALTNNTYSATFTVLKFYREGNPNGPPRFSLGYGFQSEESGQFTLHNSNSPDSEPFWVVKTGPLNQFNQYDYAIVSNWVKFPVYVMARDPERFQKYYMKEVLEYLEANKYINIMTKAFNMIAPVDYSQCQYTPTFSGAGK